MAINADDPDDFIEDVVDLAKSKYGGARFSELLDLDPDDSVMTASHKRYNREQADIMLKAAERILREASEEE